MVVKISLTEKVTFQQRLEKGVGVGRGKVWRKSCGRAPKARVCQHVPETARGPVQGLRIRVFAGLIVD